MWKGFQKCQREAISHGCPSPSAPTPKDVGLLHDKTLNSYLTLVLQRGSRFREDKLSFLNQNIPLLMMGDVSFNYEA